VGPPGVGKTYIVNQLAEALDMHAFQISLSTSPEAMALSGSSRTYSNSTPGDVAMHMARSPAINPIIILDECDKAVFISRERASITGPLLQLLEEDTSKHFLDTSLQVEMNCQYISWIATANHLDLIPEAVLNRFHVINVNPPNDEQLTIMTEKLLDTVTISLGVKGHIDIKLNRGAHEVFRGESIRNIKKIFQLATVKKISKNLAQEQITLEIDDFENFVPNRRKLPIGFIR